MALPLGRTSGAEVDGIALSRQLGERHQVEFPRPARSVRRERKNCFAHGPDPLPDVVRGRDKHRRLPARPPRRTYAQPPGIRILPASHPSFHPFRARMPARRGRTSRTPGSDRRAVGPDEDPWGTARQDCRRCAMSALSSRRNTARSRGGSVFRLSVHTGAALIQPGTRTRSANRAVPFVRRRNRTVSFLGIPGIDTDGHPPFLPLRTDGRKRSTSSPALSR